MGRLAVMVYSRLQVVGDSPVVVLDSSHCNVGAVTGGIQAEGQREYLLFQVVVVVCKPDRVWQPGREEKVYRISGVARLF